MKTRYSVSATPVWRRVAKSPDASLEGSSPRLDSTIDGQILGGVDTYIELAGLQEIDMSEMLVVPLENATWYDPLSEPHLYYRFATLKRDSTSALRFVRDYGVPYTLWESESKAEIPVWLLLFESWRLQLLHDIYTALQIGQLGFLRAKLLPKAHAALGLGFNGIVLYTEGELASRSPCKGYQDVEEEACCLISYLMTYALRRFSLVGTPFELENGFSLGIEGEGLLGALYLQLYSSIQKDKGVAKCPECRRWFIMNRTNRIYCPGTCSGTKRKRDYDAKR